MRPCSGNPLPQAELRPLCGAKERHTAYNDGMAEMIRTFVLLRHEMAAGAHWDLMLDAGDALATWQIADDPVGWARATGAVRLRVRRLADHRRAYLDYEGPVSGDRGRVIRMDRGACELLACDARRWEVRLAGDLLCGVFTLSATGGGDDADWVFAR